MSKLRYAKQPDKNQGDIVLALRDIPGLAVELNHDDILIGYRGRTYWFEIKRPDKANKAGKVFESEIKPSQKRLREEWPGHYRIVTTIEEILSDLGI